MESAADAGRTFEPSVGPARPWLMVLLLGALGLSLGCRLTGPRIDAGPAQGVFMASENEALFLQPTDLIDSEHPSVQAVVKRIANDSPDPRTRAVAIHDYVRDEIAFGFPPDFYATRASRTLELGVGYCNTKSTLFVALLRAAGVPARIHFVDLDTGLLAGIVDPGTAYVDHSYTEVYLNGRWIDVDSYIVDRPLAEEARRRLLAEGRMFGYGFHRDGTFTWDGSSDAFGQFVAGKPGEGSGSASPRPFTSRDYGVHSDVLALHRDQSSTWNRRGVLLRLLRGLAFREANSRAARLRSSNAQQAPGQGAARRPIRSQRSRQ